MGWMACAHAQTSMHAHAPLGQINATRGKMRNSPRRQGGQWGGGQEGSEGGRGILLVAAIIVVVVVGGVGGGVGEPHKDGGGWLARDVGEKVGPVCVGGQDNRESLSTDAIHPSYSHCLIRGDYAPWQPPK